jgi:hypothetical protein
VTRVLFEINGKLLDWREMCEGPDAATGAMLGALDKHFQERFDGWRCPVHGESPTIRFYGPSALDMEREVQACCSEFLADVWKRM